MRSAARGNRRHERKAEDSGYRRARNRRSHAAVASTFRYQPFYCEENIWHLCQDADVGPGERLVAVLGGQGGDGRPTRCALWHQRAARPGEAILWDYHVVLLVRDRDWQVWDLDTDLGLPVAAETYLRLTFGDQRRMPPPWRPRFRVIPAEQYVATLCSDRAHMRARDGRYLRPPPAWDPPGVGAANLASFTDLAQPFIGEVTDLPGLRARLGER